MAGRLAIGMVIACAVLCLVPVVFGAVVTRWSRWWSRADRKGPLL